MSPAREARLRPEYADLYPELKPGVWYIAAVARDLVLAPLVRQLGPDVRLPGRVLKDAHFEFRGGTPRTPGAERRTRRDER